LIVAFNRPELLYKLIQSLSKVKPRIIRVSIDGPRNGNHQDKSFIDECKKIIAEINWTTDIKIKENETNLGLRYSIPAAVNWVLSEFETLIVLEDDVEVGESLIPYMEYYLNKFADSKSIAHISGYNFFAKDLDLEEISARYSRFPESYAWATWKNKWSLYNDKLVVPSFQLLYRNGCGLTGALSWRREFLNTKRTYINSWAYRWTASLWNNDQMCISPSRNLINYNGNKLGTNTFFKQRWSELPIVEIGKFSEDISFNDKVEKEIATTAYRNKIKDLILLYVITMVLSIKRICNLRMLFLNRP